MSDRVVASVRVACERCGTVEIPMVDVRLAMSDPRDDEDTRNTVEFVCPGCGLPGSVRVDERMTRLVAGTDVTLVVAPPSGSESHKRVGGVAEGR